jgi:hypothetical protein
VTARAKKALGFASVLAAAVTIFFLYDEPTSGETPAAETASAPLARTPEGEPVPSAKGLAPNPRAQVPLPPVDAPLALIVEPLAARADAGDSRAACRLAMELIRCQGALFLADIPSFDSTRLEAELEASGKLDAADRVAADALEQARVARECLALPAHLVDRGPHYLGQAARAGEPEAMVRYADSQFWPPDGRGFLSHPEFDLWRRDAPGMIERAFAAGVPESAFAMMDAYQSDIGLVGSLIPNDPVKAEAVRLLMTRLHGWQEPLTLGRLDASTQARVRELARQWHEGPFQGRSYRGQDRSTFQPAALPKRGGVPHEFCTADRPVP